jgi:uncharacterized protein (TIGR02996 family)
MTTTDEPADPALAVSGFMAAILAEPADDVARLVFADWLDENGQPLRAAFVREQVADPGNTQTVGPWDDIVYRGAVLFRNEGYAGGFPPNRRPPTFVFRRGFPDELVISGFDVRPYAAEFAAFPLTRVTVRSARPRKLKGDHYYRAEWRTTGNGGRAYVVPADVGAELRGGRAYAHVRRYRTADEALDALSAVLLARGRAAGSA